MEQKKNSLGYELLLALASLIWGVAVVAQKAGVAVMGPFTFSAVRCLMAGVVLILI
ncbi:MAG: EamA family transporter, partial [Lachnospiraceae bacterium]|nr:EamA family transporter [Lachnospiraceae bacterium]